ncbi:hypothetical protein GOC31_26995 [Sinorhizobium meliloti]|nr:hypothetical protein [Sinorhizobium meliloti]MDX0252306.1 hypothetical protein [Sinorhizobium meliloti]
MFSRLSLAAGAIAGGFVALLVTQTVNALWIIPAAREEGRNSNAPNWIPQPTKQLENCEMKLIALALTAARALSAAGCTSTQQVSASKDRLNQAARAVVGTSLIGARANFEPTLHSVLDGCIERVHNLGQLALCLLLFGGLRERINVGHWLSPLSTPGLPYEDGVTVSVVTLPAAHFRCEQKDALPFAKSVRSTIAGPSNVAAAPALAKHVAAFGEVRESNLFGAPAGAASPAGLLERRAALPMACHI